MADEQRPKGLFGTIGHLSHRTSTLTAALASILAQHYRARPRVHNRRQNTAPTDAVYIGRGTPWGNPFVVGAGGDRNAVCDKFEAEILPTLDLMPLVGKDLVCHCKPLRCHGDSILEAIGRLKGKANE